MCRQGRRTRVKKIHGTVSFRHLFVKSIYLHHWFSTVAYIVAYIYIIYIAIKEGLYSVLCLHNICNHTSIKGVFCLYVTVSKIKLNNRIYLLATVTLQKLAELQQLVG